MSTVERAIIIIDDDDSDNEEGNHHQKQNLDGIRNLSQDQKNSIETFCQILNVHDYKYAKNQLSRCEFDLERAISRELDNKLKGSSSIKVAAKPSPSRPPSTNVARITKFEVSKKRFGLELSEVWKTCYQQSPTPFVDPVFPPTRKSLDGRIDNKESEQIVLCNCNVPASAKTVQSDGPNYGRFYLCCGRKLKNNNRRWNNNNNNNNGQKETSTEKPCNFFRWDTDGSKGTGNGYDTRWSQLEWYSFVGSDYVLYNKQMEADHIRQGAVGNCWFLSALGVVAEKPYLVNALVPHMESNEKGCYQINLCLDGTWTPIIVDSNLPVVYHSGGGNNHDDDDGKKKALTMNGKASLAKHDHRGGVAMNGGTVMAYPAFCAIPKGQLWPALIEKSYAKAHGSYANLSGGFIAEGLADLTGAPCETVVLDPASGNDKKEELWVKILSACEAGFLLGVATSRGGDGLVGGHAYSILSVREIHGSMVGSQSKVTDFFTNPKKKLKREERSIYASKSDNDNIIRLIQIRNPWGKKEWKGAWGADSEKWTNRLRKKIGDDSWAKDSGTFWMSFDDVLDRFHHMDICKTREGWVHTSVKGFFRTTVPSLSSSPDLYTLNVQNRAWAFISIIQPKKRANTESRYWYCDPQMILFKRAKNVTGAVWESDGASLSGVSRRNDLEVFLDPTYEYCIVAFAYLPLKNGRDQSFRIACYSSSPVELGCRPRKQNDLDSTLVSSLHTNLMKHERRMIYRIAPQCILAVIELNGCVYFTLYNGASASVLSLMLTVTLAQGIAVAFGSNGDTHVVPQRCQKILLVVMTTGKMSSTTHLSFKYISDTKPCATSGAGNLATADIGLSTLRGIGLVGDSLCSSGDETCMSGRGGDMLDISSWIPQLGRC